VRHAALAACGSLQVEFQGQAVDLALPFRRASMMQLASEGAGRAINFDLSLDELRDIAKGYHIKVDASWGKGKLICEIYEEVAEGAIVQPTFVIDHPVEVSPLAKRKADDENVTDRFELLICGHEYANAFTELNDPVDQAARFQAQVDAKSSGDDEAMGYDADYIRALEYGMPPAGGLGIGIDRLVMLLTDSASIRDVLLFPHMRDEA
ncbi:MAG: amino acid--tRNA ligase-related protein, partial [Raoultibacter sp.]